MHVHLFTWRFLFEPLSQTQVRLQLWMTCAWCPFRKVLLPITRHWGHTVLAARVDALCRDWFWRPGMTLLKVVEGWTSDSLWTAQERSWHGVSSGIKHHGLFRAGNFLREGLGYTQLKSCSISQHFSSLSEANILAGLGGGDFWWAAMHCSKMLLKHAAFMELVQCEVEFFLVAGSEYEKFISLVLRSTYWNVKTNEEVV